MTRPGWNQKVKPLKEWLEPTACDLGSLSTPAHVYRSRCVLHLEISRTFVAAQIRKWRPSPSWRLKGVFKRVCVF